MAWRHPRERRCSEWRIGRSSATCSTRCWTRASSRSPSWRPLTWPTRSPRASTSEGPPGIAVRHLVRAISGRRRRRAAPPRSSSDDAPCILHRADGLLGQPLSPFVELAERGSRRTPCCSSKTAAATTKRLRLVPQRLLSATEVDLDVRASRRRGRLPARSGRAARAAESRSARRSYSISPPWPSSSLATADAFRLRVVRKWRHFAGDALDLLDMNRTMLDALDSEAIAGALRRQSLRGTDRHPSHGVRDLKRHHRAGDDRRRRADHRLLHRSAHLDRGARSHRRSRARALDRARRRERAPRRRTPRGEHRRHARRASSATSPMPRALRLQVGDGDEVALC